MEIAVAGVRTKPGEVGNESAVLSDGGLATVGASVGLADDRGWVKSTLSGIRNDTVLDAIEIVARGDSGSCDGFEFARLRVVVELVHDVLRPVSRYGECWD